MVGLAVLLTSVVYHWMRRQEPTEYNESGSPVFQKVYRLGARTHLSESKVWTWLRETMDNRFFGGRDINREPDLTPKDPSARPDPRIR